VSSEDQARGESPHHHEERARLYAQSKGWEVIEVYDLAGVSGKTVAEHPEAKRMLKDVARNHITGLIFSKLARLARNTRELLDFSEYFRKHDADLISLQESIDTSTPAGRLFYTMIAAMAQWEREEIGERVKASISIRAKLGKSINGKAPYGYRWQDRKLVQVPEEAANIRKIFDLFVEHKRKGVVAGKLNDSGCRSRRGRLWQDSTVLRILTEPSCRGTYYVNRYRKTGSWRMELKPESEWGLIPCEAIISEKVWENVSRILENQVKRPRKPGKPPVHLFAGLAICACGARMYVPSNTPKYVCFKCRNKIPIIDLEAIFHDELKVYFADKDAIGEQLKQATAQVADKTKALAVHRQEMQRVKDEMERTHRLYLDEEINGKTFGNLYRPLEQRLEQLTRELPRMEADSDILKVNQLTAAELAEEADDFYKQWPQMDAGDKRRIVENIVREVRVGQNEIDITFSCSPR